MKMKGLVPFVFLLLIVRVISTSSSLHRSPITMDGLLDDYGNASPSRGKSKDEDSEGMKNTEEAGTSVTGSAKEQYDAMISTLKQGLENQKDI